MNKLPAVNLNHFIAKPLVELSGYTWTLASMLGYMLSEAEQRFGERDRTYTMLGVEFRHGTPQIWFPGNCKHIVIQLEAECMYDTPRACYQLSHEVVHLLSPNGTGEVSILEEGLATCYSEDYMRSNFNLDWKSGIASYESAASAVRAFLQTKPDAIKEMRFQEPTISQISAEIIMSVCSDMDRKTAEFMCQRFVR